MALQTFARPLTDAGRVGLEPTAKGRCVRGDPRGGVRDHGQTEAIQAEAHRDPAHRELQPPDSHTGQYVSGPDEARKHPGRQKRGGEVGDARPGSQRLQPDVPQRCLDSVFRKSTRRNRR